MKRIGIMLMLIVFTVVIIMFPSLYYDNRDKALGSYQNENVYKNNTITEISLEKEIEILTDEDSKYIKQNSLMNNKEKQALIEMKRQAEEITGVYMDDDIIKDVTYNKVIVINSSAYNIYSIDLAVCEFYDEKSRVLLNMIYDINKRKILRLQLDALVDNDFLFQKRMDETMKQVEKHYESYKNWECNVSDSFIIIVCSNERKMSEIVEKIMVLGEGDKSQQDVKEFE